MFNKIKIIFLLNKKNQTLKFNIYLYYTIFFKNKKAERIDFTILPAKKPELR